MPVLITGELNIYVVTPSFITPTEFLKSLELREFLFNYVFILTGVAVTCV